MSFNLNLSNDCDMNARTKGVVVSKPSLAYRIYLTALMGAVVGLIVAVIL